MCGGCCCQNQSIIFLANSGIISCLASIAFEIWTFVDTVFERKGAKTAFIIGFILICVSLVGFIVILILELTKSNENKKTMYTIGKIISIVITVLINIAGLFISIPFIVVLYDLAKIHKNVAHVPVRIWLSVIIPFAIVLATLTMVDICCHDLRKKFTEEIRKSDIPKPDETQLGINQNNSGAMPPMPNNQVQPGIFPNNYGAMPPMPNNQVQPGIFPNNYGTMPPNPNSQVQPVIIKQSE
jgi:hypothetical protein